jgi:hypothetical protein
MLPSRDGRRLAEVETGLSGFAHTSPGSTDSGGFLW